jgi:hypothetical protein
VQTERRDVGFVPDAARFVEEYPKEVNQLATQYFCQICKTSEIQSRLFSNLAAWKNCDQWRKGLVKAAGKWLSEGDWDIVPKISEPPMEDWVRNLKEKHKNDPQ